MTSLTILDLNDDCLITVLSILDLKSFYNFTLTCKRFNQVSSNNSRCWPLKVLKRKAEFYLKKFIVLNCRFELDNGGDELAELKDLLQNASKCSESVEGKLREVQNVWDICGPVAAKLFTLVESIEEMVYSSAPVVEGTSFERFLFLELPKCNEELYIHTLVYVDLTGSHDNEVCVIVNCKEDLSFAVDETINSITLLAENFRNLSEEEIHRLARPFKPVVALVESELQETNLLTEVFIVWFSFFFLSKPVVELAEDRKLYFSDDKKNQRPTMKEAQGFFRKTEDFSKFAEKWMQESEEEQRPKIIVEILENLVKRKAKKTTETLCEETILFYSILTSYDFRQFSKELLIELFTCTTNLSSTISIATDKTVVSYAQFMLKGGETMDIEGKLIVKEEGGYDISFKFENPGSFMVEIKATKEYNDELSDDEQDDFFEKFSPITTLLQECINESVKDSGDICPLITDNFTVLYFMRVLYIDAVKTYILGDSYGIFVNSD